MMTYKTRDYKRGIPKTGAVASIIAPGGANAVNLYLLSLGRTCKIRKLHIFNGQPGPVQVLIGTGTAGLWAQAMPPIYAVNGIELTLEEDQIEDVEFSADITAAASAAGAAPANVQVQATVEEYPGPTG